MTLRTRNYLCCLFPLSIDDNVLLNVIKLSNHKTILPDHSYQIIVDIFWRRFGIFLLSIPRTFVTVVDLFIDLFQQYFKMSKRVLKYGVKNRVRKCIYTRNTNFVRKVLRNLIGKYRYNKFLIYIFKLLIR